MLLEFSRTFTSTRTFLVHFRMKRMLQIIQNVREEFTRNVWDIYNLIFIRWFFLFFLCCCSNQTTNQEIVFKGDTSLSLQDILPIPAKSYDKNRAPKLLGQPTVVYFHVTVLSLDSINEESMVWIVNQPTFQQFIDFFYNYPCVNVISFI